MGKLTRDVWDEIPAGSIVRFSDGLEGVKMHKDAYDGITDNWVAVVKGPDAGHLLHVNCLMSPYDPFQNQFKVKLC